MVFIPDADDGADLSNQPGIGDRRSSTGGDVLRAPVLNRVCAIGSHSGPRRDASRWTAREDAATPESEPDAAMSSHNFLFVSADAALIGDLAWQVRREGNDVRYYVESESDRDIADGFVPKTDDWRADIDWADVVIFDDIWVGSDVGTGQLAQELRAEGHAVVGGTPATDRLEEDRGYAMEILESEGVNTIEHREFEEFQAGIRHVRENPAPYVIKPLGEVQNVKRLLYVGRDDDGGDVVDVLRAYEKAWGHRMTGFQLQRKVEGVEVAVCGFFDGDSFVEPVNFNFEHKKLFPGNVGSVQIS